MKEDRFLTGILIGIAVLVIAAIGLFFLRREAQTYGPETDPAGVARNYILALQKQDYERAYTYLANIEDKPTLAEFRQPFVNYQGQEVSSTVLDLAELEGRSQETTVSLTLIRGASGPFNSPNREVSLARLRQEGGAWKIVEMPYPFWSYEWAYSEKP
ncbi:MAG: hypothetical protein JW987_08890 [Anaerolineaceae bacterium]|nr:hypothetical protein [Anaerolineaceae bacterium]